MSDRIKDLRRILAHLDTLYELGEDCVHPDTGQIVPDDLYDDWVAELKGLSPNEPRFTHQTSGSDVDLGTKVKMVHNPPMVSINKASHEDLGIQEAQLFKWLDESANGVDGPVYTLEDRDYNGSNVTYPRNYFYQEYKLDGAACSIHYEDGVLKQAGLRPRDGINGLDVTANIVEVLNVPKRLKEKVTLTLRGELVCLWPDFEKVQKMLAKRGEKARANPRNHAAGAIQNDDPKKVKEARLTFIAYGIENHDNPPYETEIERAKWCNKKLGIQYVQARPFNFYELQKMEDNRKNLDYMVDGAIIGVNNLEAQEQLGRTGDSRTGNPKGKIAWKFREETATVTLADIEAATGRTGKITPVGIFTNSVRLAETDVSRCTLHNFGMVKRFGIRPGTRIKVLKAGSIIPKVIDVIDGTGVPAIPDMCPSCGQKAVLKEGGKIKDKTGNEVTAWDLWCENNDCPAKHVSGLQHYLTTFGVLGLGESRVESLVSKGAVKTFADFYRLDVSAAVACGLSERQALLAIAAIHMVPNPEKEKDNGKLLAKIEKAKKGRKKIPAWQLFASFGIPTAGKSAGKALIEHFEDFDAIGKASATELSGIEDIGDKTAEVIESWFEANRNVVADVLSHVEPELPKTGPLTGTTFCLSGISGKAKWQKEIEDRGGKVTGSVGRKVDYLVAGPKSGAKTEKAKELGIPVLDTDGLEKML